MNGHDAALRSPIRAAEGRPVRLDLDLTLRSRSGADPVLGQASSTDTEPGVFRSRTRTLSDSAPEMPA